MLHIYFGNGKGKTSAALGLILRAAGYNKKILLVQFLKPADLFSGEHKSLVQLGSVKQIRFFQRHPFFLKKQTPEKLQQTQTQIKTSIKKLKHIIKKEKFDILVLDEVLNLIGSKFLKETELINIIKCHKDTKEIILTGRPKLSLLIRCADYVTELKEIKHPYRNNIHARKGIEF